MSGHDYLKQHMYVLENGLVLHALTMMQALINCQKFNINSKGRNIEKEKHIVLTTILKKWLRMHSREINMLTRKH